MFPTLPKPLVNGEKMIIYKTTSAPRRTRAQDECYMPGPKPWNARSEMSADERCHVKPEEQQMRQFCHQECHGDLLSCSLEIDLEFLDVLGLIVADEVAETRIRRS